MRSDHTAGNQPPTDVHRQGENSRTPHGRRPLPILDGGQIDKTKPSIPFRQRPTCTIKEACSASGLGRTKFYELIKGGQLTIISIGRRRLVQVPSLLKLLRLEDVN